MYANLDYMYQCLSSSNEIRVLFMLFCCGNSSDDNSLIRGIWDGTNVCYQEHYPLQPLILNLTLDIPDFKVKH